LSKPIYAAVELERQRLGEDGQWGQWEDVPRIKVDPRREELRIIEDANNLPSGSIAVRMLRYGDQKVQADLLQPEPYQIASSEEQWYPPVLHEKYLKYLRDKEAQEKRDKLEAEQAKVAEERERAQGGRVDGRARMPAANRGGGGGEAEYMKMIGAGGGYPGAASRGTVPDRTRERDRRLENTTATQATKNIVKPDVETELYDEMKKMSLWDKEVNELSGQMVFWAYDDSVEPGMTYRYRIRLGVFNPVAGTGQLKQESMEYNKKVVLWSRYSDESGPVEIPKRLYFFPVGVQEASKGVDIQVCKYVLGYWYSEQFMVKRGEVIGKEVKFDPSQKSKDRPGVKDKDATEPTAPENLTLPETIDYSTGAMLVDVVPVSGGYYDMLYSYDGTKIERVSAKLMYWPEGLRGSYSEIKNLERKPKLALRAWSTTGGILGSYRGLMPRGMPIRGGDRGGQGQMSPEEMMYMMMIQGGRPGGPRQ
jgi:hypothetical protein